MKPVIIARICCCTLHIFCIWTNNYHNLYSVKNLKHYLITILNLDFSAEECLRRIRSGKEWIY